LSCVKGINDGGQVKDHSRRCADADRVLSREAPTPTSEAAGSPELLTKPPPPLPLALPLPRSLRLKTLLSAAVRLARAGLGGGSVGV